MNGAQEPAWSDNVRPNVLRINNGIFSSNTYLCLLSKAGECAIIDPGLDSKKIDEEIRKRGLLPRAVLCTHGHFDHLGSAKYFQTKYAIPLYLHKSDQKLSKSSNFLLMACKIDFRIEVPEADHAIEDQFEVKLGDDRFQFHACPGHTAGSCAIHFKDYLFTGDTLYRSAVGLVSLPGEDREELKLSILKIWRTFADDTWIFPGHGSSGLLSEIKRMNFPLRKFLGLSIANDPRATPSPVSNLGETELV